MKTAYFGQCSYCPNIDKNNYPEETELDTNPSLTLARTLTLSTGERSFGHFTSSRCYDTTIVNFAYMNSPKNLGRDSEYIYVVGEVFPWGGNSVIFSVCASISRTGVQLHEIDIWLDPRSLNEFYDALMFPKVNIIVT